MTQFKQVLAPDFSEGVDRKLLSKVRDRFLDINQERLRLCRQAMSLRQRDMLALLPLLYHVNHPLLPGYVGQNTPHGISGYAPDKTALSLAKAYSQSFKFRQDRRSVPSVFSIFMMGSTGTLAHSESSDVDLWLCHAPDLSSSALAELKEKADRLDQWATSQGLELHTFLMNAEAFKAGGSAPELDSESSGSAQHYLLLDEFYRTAILLSGRYPLWWLIPSSLEHEYNEHTRRLLGQRFVKESDVIDFGHVADIPKSELVGAGLWQLYKSIDAPYKSVLKLLLAEVYAQELPAQPCLSLVFKQAVYNDELDVEQLDPYLLIYQRLERYLLSHNELKRLDLVRKSFYLKVNKKLSKKAGTRGASWQRELLESVVSEWGWQESDFKRLDERHAWKVDEVIVERQQLFSELTNSYRFLSDYARLNNVGSAITDKDLNLLGRKLNATFQRKAGKVEKVNPGIAPNIWEESMALHHSSSQPFQVDRNAWLLYRDLSSTDDAAFFSNLRKTPNLIEMLVWLFFNGVIDNKTRLNLVPGKSGVSLHEVRNILAALERTFALPLPVVSQDAFLFPAHVKKLVLFINIGVDPVAKLTGPGLLRLSDRTDSLGYSSRRSNLVKTIDQVAFNSWNEMSARRYEHGETLMQNLQAYLLMCARQAQQEPCELNVYCYTSQRAEAIATRVKTLFKDARSVFFAGIDVQSSRYVLEIEERFYVIQHEEEEFRYTPFSDRESLMQHLSSVSRDYSQIALDRYALNDDMLLRYALRRSKPNAIQIFYDMTGNALETCIIDEHGSVLRHTGVLEEEIGFQARLHAFLQTVLERRQLDQALEGRGNLPDIEWFKVQSKAQADGGRMEFRAMTNLPRRQAKLLCITAFYDGMELQYDIGFEDKEFTFAEHGHRQVEALVHYLSRQGRSQEIELLALEDISYPSDPMLMRSSMGQVRGSLDYLRLYQEIDQRLRALIH